MASFQEGENSTTSWQTDLNSTFSTEQSFNFTTHKSIKELLYNGTGYYIEDETEPVYDLKTVFLALFATLIPLVLALLTAFGIRVLWMRYKRGNKGSQYDGILRQDATSESLASRPLHSHLLNDKESCETQLDMSTEDLDSCNDVLRTNQVRSNHSNTNGSIITMTLKNNHLIVETEERNDIEEDSRETTMKYSPNARDGVFVVEVQQGVRRSPGSSSNTTTTTTTTIKQPEEVSLSVSDQCALVHSPPDRFNDSTSKTSNLQQTKTGLTSSDTSLSDHQTYSYTNQEGYDHGQLGYVNYKGYENEEGNKSLLLDDRPKIVTAIYKNQFSVEDLDAVEELQEVGKGQEDGGKGECDPPQDKS